jgi:hypothetical protein
VFRFGQGLALGGSWDGLPSLLALNAPANKPRLVRHAGPAGRAHRLLHCQRGLFCLPADSSLPRRGLPRLGLALSAFYVAFAINVVALFARLRLVATE